MTVEAVFNYPSNLNASYPAASDPRSEGDDHIRGLKTQQKTTWPNISGAVTATHTELNYSVGVTSAIQTQLNAKLASASALGRWVQLQTQPVSGVSAVTFVNGTNGAVLSSTYDAYVIEFDSVQVATDAVNLLLRTDSDGGASYDAGASDYRYEYRQQNGGAGTSGGATGTSIILNGGATLSNVAGEIASGTIRFWRPSAAQPFYVTAEVVFADSATGALTLVHTGGRRVASADVDAIQILASSGNISGNFTLFARVKS